MNLRDDNSSLIADDRQVAVNGLDVLDAHTVAGNVFVDHAPRTSHSQVAALSSNNTGASDSRADEFGNFRVDGEFGSLIVGTDGNYRYIRTAKQTGSSDLFTYKLIDRNHHDSDAILTIRFVEDAGDFLTLPDGVGPDDLHLVGGDLLVALPDGSQLVFVDGAMFKFVLMADGTQILTAVGPLQSSGGNFLVEVGEISASDGIGPPMLLGDLLAPTELVIDEPVRVEELPPVFRKDDEFGIIIITPGDPAASVNEAGLPARASEPAGSDSTSNTESVAGTIQFISGDPTFSISINGTPITAVGQTISGTFGVLMITSFAETSIGFVYTLADNTAGDSTVDLFSVAVTDGDSDIATATLSIEIVDDLPVIQPDTSTTPAGLDPASGNVITDAEGDGGGDAVGADGAVVTAVASVNVPASPDLDPGPDFQITGQYGVLTLSQDGSYSYIRNPGTPGEVSDVFSYTLTDGDGDSSTTTLTIFIDDATPVVGANALVQLDDDVLAGGNAGGTGDDIDAANLTGTLSGEGGDIPLTWAFQLTGAPAGFNYVSNGAGGVLIQQGGITVLTVTLNPANGAYTVTQNAPIDHAAGGDENNQGFTLAYTVTDVDGGSAAGTFAIDVDDDTPVASAATTQPVLVVDETNLAVNASASFAGVFTTAFGADGSAGNIAYTLGINAGSTGLVDTASGEAVVLALEGSQVVGRAGAGGAIVFTVSVNVAGTVTLDQVRAVVHPNAANPDEPISLAADNLVTLTATLTDGDGDTATATANIGQNLSFEDAAPVAVGDVGAIPAGSFDPASGNVITDAEGDGGGDAVGADGAVVTAVASVNVPASPDLDPGPNFQIAGQYGVLTLSQDGSASYIRNPGSPGEVSDVFTYTLTDGDGDSSTATVTFSIGDASPIAGANALVQLDDDVLAGGNAGGTGDDIDAANLTGTLSGEGGDIPLTWAFQLTGAPAGFNYVSNGAGGVLIQQGGITVLTVTLNPANGAYTVTQNAPIDHAAGGDENNQGFTLAYTVTDVDGGSAAGTFAIDVDDDTPVASAATTQPVLVVDETNLAVNASASFAGVFTTAFGADGSAANIAYTLGINAGSTGLVDTASGEAVSLVLNGSVVEGRTAVSNLLVFSVSVDALGTVTLDQLRAVVHPNADDPGEPISLAADNLVTLTATLTDGDGDTATATADIGQNLSFEDDGPVAVGDVGAIPAGSFDPASGNVITDAEGDGGGDAVGADGAVVTAVASVNVPASPDLDPGPDFQIAGQYGVLTLSQDGSYSYIRNPGTPGEVSDVFTYTLTDGDGDSSTTTFSIFVGDASPIAGANALVQLDDDVLAGGNAGGTGDDIDAANLTGTLSGEGGDIPLTWAFQLTGAPAGFNYVSNGAGGVLIQQGGITVLTVTLNPANGAYTVTQNAPIDHAAGGDENNQGFTLAYTVTDVDGGSAAGTFAIDVDDDTPVASAATTQPVLVVDESNLAANASASFAGVFTTAFGADGSAGNIAYTLGINAGSTGLVDTATGNAVVLALEGSQVVGRAGAGGAIVFTVSVNVAGTVTLDQVRAVVHPNAANPDEPISLAADNLVTLTATLTDGDGDTATATANIGQNLSFEDAAPVAVGDVGAIPADSFDPASGNVITDAEGDGGGDAVGADGAVVTAVASVNVPASPDLDPGPNFQIAGQYGVLTLSQDGSASYIRNPGTPGEVSDVFSYTLTDGDGDSSTATVTFSIGDASPIAGANALVQLGDDALAGGNAGGTGDDIDAANLTGTLSGEGGDIPLTWAFQLTGAPAGFNYVSNGAGGVLIQQGGITVLTVTLNPANGAYTVTQNAPIDHAAGGDENNQGFTLAYTVTDVDGGSAAGTFAIDVDDDTPVASAATTQPLLVVDETNLAVNASASFAGVFTTAFGADGASSVTYTLDVNAGSTGLVDTASGEAVSLVLNGSVVEGRTAVSNLLVFSVSVDALGTVTLDQVRAVVHPNADDPGEPISLATDNLVTLTATLTDGDGDTASATANIGANLRFTDDGPAPANDTDTITAGPASGNVITDAEGDGGGDAVGADGAVVTAVASVNIPSSIDTDPGPNFLITGQYGQLKLNQDGSYSYAQFVGTPAGVTDAFTYFLTDADGDRASASLTVSLLVDLTAPPEGLFSIPSRQTVGMNQIVMDNGDLIKIDPVGAARPFGSLSLYLAETSLGGVGLENDVDAIHVLDDGRIVFSTANGELRTAAGTIRPNSALGQIDAFIYNPATNSSTIATGLPGLVFPTAFASSEKDKLQDLHVLSDGSVIFSLDGSGTLGGVSFQGNDLIHWDGVTATMVFQASTQLVGARLYTGVFGSQTQIGTVNSSIGNEITSLHVLSFAADGITPNRFVISTGSNIVTSTFGQTVLDKTNLIEIFRDDAGDYWVNSVPYFDSGDNNPADDGEEIDAVWLGDFKSLPPPPDIAPPEGLFSIPSRQSVGMNQLVADNGDLVRIDPVGALRPFSSLSVYLAETNLGGPGQDNNVDAIHVLDDGRIVFSTSNGELRTAAGTIRPDAALGQIDAFIYNPATNSSTIATGLPGLVFPTAFASSEKDKLEDLHVLRDGSVIFSLDGSGTLGGLSFQGNDLIRWDGVTATMVFQASTQLVGARLYTGVFGSQTLVGTVRADIDNEITSLHVLSFAADGITPTHFVISTGGDIRNAANGQTVLDKTQLIEVFRDNSGVYWVNSKAYFNSGDNSPADNGEEIDAVWLGDLDAFLPASETFDADIASRPVGGQTRSAPGILIPTVYGAELAKLLAAEIDSLTAHSVAGISLSSDSIGYTAARGYVQGVDTNSFTRALGSTGALADDPFKLAASIAGAGAITGAVAAAALAAVGPTADHDPDALGARVSDSAGQISTTMAHILASDPAPGILGTDQYEGRLADAKELRLVQAIRPETSDNNHSLIGSETVETAVPLGHLQYTVLASAAIQPNASSIVTQPGIAIPSAAVLAEAFQHSAAGDLAHAQNLSHVLADVLSDGGDGPSIDALLLASLPGPGNGEGSMGLDSLAGGDLTHGTWGMGSMIPVLHVDLLAEAATHVDAVATA